MNPYYENANDFDGIEKNDYAMPYDVKRLIKHGRYTYHKLFYRYFDAEQRMVVMNERTQSVRYQFIPDISYSVGGKIRDEILLNRFFMKRIESMKIINL